MYAEDRELTELELRPVPVLTTAQEAWLTGINSEAFSLKNAVNLYANRVSPGDELARIEARDQVSDEELIARMQVAPDMGGSMLVELSDFVRNRSRK